MSELLYIWIEEYKIIQKQGFNFSSNWRCTFSEEENLLKIEEGRKLADDFFGKNIVNVTAIVGENGSGKSTLLEFLLSEYLTPYDYIYNNVIAVWKIKTHDQIYFRVHYNDLLETEESLKIEHPDGLNVKDLISFNTEAEAKEPFHHKRKPHPELGFTKVLYSNSLDQRLFYFRGINISTNFLLMGGEIEELNRFQLQIEATSNNKLSVHFIKDIKRQIDLIQSDFGLPFTPPSELYLFPSKLILSDLFSYQIEREEKDAINFFSTRLELTMAREELSYLMVEFYEAAFAIAMKNYLDNLGDEQRDIEGFINGIFAEEEGSSPITKLHDKFEGDELELLEELIEFLNDKDGLVIERRGQSHWILTQEHWASLYEFLSENIQALDYISLSWDLPSTGELAFLKLFSRIYALRDGFEKAGYPHFYLFLDEGETGFHPQWQKNYLKFILDFLNDHFKPKVTIILTSHSPFIVSDLPTGNVVFLRKNIETGNCEVVDSPESTPKTFGANIHVLLSDSFFLQDGLIGEFSKEKIQRVITWIVENEDDTGKDQIKEVIDQVGEGILRLKLLDMYNEKLLRLNP